MTLPFFRSPTQYMHVSEPATHTHRVFQMVLFRMDREWESFRVAGDTTCEGESPRNRRSHLLLANPHKPSTNDRPESGRDLQRSSQSLIRLLLTLSDVTHVAHPVAIAISTLIWHQRAPGAHTMTGIRCLVTLIFTQ